MHERQPVKRGMILLIVLCVLAMFGLIGITFIILSGNARRSAVSQAKVDQANNPPDRLANNVIMQILRGTNSPASVLRPHGLLEDLYGNGWAQGRITPVDNPIVQPLVAGGQLLQFTFAGFGANALSTPHQKYVGCVLTMTSGPAAGRSTRIVGFDSANNRFQIMTFDGVSIDDNGTSTDISDDVAYFGTRQLDGDFIINGNPFSGTGFGYDPSAKTTSPLLKAADPVVAQPYALLPNPRPFTPSGTYDGPAGPGGANEDYDAADYQNMLLAAQVTKDTTIMGVAAPMGTVPIPSLHRPALVNYHFHQLAARPASFWPDDATTLELKWQAFVNPEKKPDGTDWKWSNTTDKREFETTIADYKRRIILRPITEDHPNFTGSNTADPNAMGMYIINAAGGVVPQFNWDVDNDGDGIIDSIWVDVGLPMRTMRDGRQYKPLAAILCVDMDGRLNLNAHGCLAQAEVQTLGGLLAGGSYIYANPPIAANSIIPGGVDLEGTPLDPDTDTDPGPYAPGPYTAGVIRGQGVGPAEINLRALFDTSTDQATNVCRRLFSGDAVKQIEGRYGELLAAPAAPGVSATLDVLSYNRKLDCPLDSSDPISAYGTPVDSKGTLAVYLDLRGQPLYENLTAHRAANGLIIDDPYELNLSRNAPRALGGRSTVDNPFSLAELEALLRPFDTDASMLPSRLPSLLRHTGDPSGKMTNEELAATGLDRQEMQALRHKVTTESWSLPCPAATLLLNSATSSQKNFTHISEILITDKSVPADQIEHLLSPDLLAGLRMDLNRVFGDGQDNNGNNVVDATDDLLSRQLYARHLYVLAMAVVDVAGMQNNMGLAAEEVARIIAQWAVNVVDFRDRDSIMTGFEYDPQPFTDGNCDGNPWDVDGDLTTDEDANPADLPNTYIVWGCERPEMLITETLAFHDRRTENLNTDPSGKYVAGGDLHFDQRVRPQGSLFVELYNPWTENESLPGELYKTVNVADVDHTGIDLRATAGNSPVWRMIIVAGTNNHDPDDPTAATPVPIDRSIYFVEPGTGFSAPGGGCQYFPDKSNLPDISVLKAGRYAVVGPGNGGGASTTYLGFRAAATLKTPLEKFNDTNSRRIVLNPSTDPRTRQVSVFADGGPDPVNDDLNALAIQAPIAVVINPADLSSGRPMRLSVSEPTTGYPAYTDTDAGVYDPPRDSTFAVDSTDAAKMGAGTTSRYRWVYLQRLASPLQPYDADTNPYRVIDKSQIDLTAFNGLANDSTADPSVRATTVPAYAFFSRERGEDEESAPLPKPSNLWAVELPAAAGNPPMAIDANKTDTIEPHHFGEKFAHTLGYLNEGFGSPLSGPVGYEGSPPAPFPWLAWNNRPFISVKELLLVPARRSSQLLETFTMQGSATARPYTDPLVSSHIFNYFQSTDGTVENHAAGFHRILEFLRVPSPFVGTQLQTAPNVFSAAGGNHSFHPPFNYISKYRNPGRVNINTAASENVWKGVINDVNATPRDDMTPWGEVVDSRRGYTGAGMFAMHEHYPTRFANPFRSSAGLYLVPHGPPGFSLKNDIIQTEANATLMRSNGNYANATEPLFRLTRHGEHNAPFRNTYFRYQPLHRLDSILTTRSNVYAVWVTVGYFEVRPTTWIPSAADHMHNDRGLTQAQFQKIYPDGFQLGQELGCDSGNITRHRSFYIIDRSIPVGFKRGEDLNTENAILLRRFIE